MKKIEVDIDTFKALSSEERILLLKTLDRKKITKEELQSIVDFSEETIQSTLHSLMNAHLIKQKKKQNHTYYTLTWKASSLLHPENNRVLTLFSLTLASLATAVIGLSIFIQQKLAISQEEPVLLVQQDSYEFAPKMGPMLETTSQASSSSPFPHLILISVVIFLSLLFISIWRYDKNKRQRL